MRAPSYEESVQIGLDWAVDWVLTNPDRPVILGGYSQGGECASRVRMEFEPGRRLAHLRQNFVAGYVFGNPARHLGHTYYGGPPTSFDGIGQFRLPEMGWDWCELVDPGDLYATSARGLTGEIERDVYRLCTTMQLHEGALAFCQTLIRNLMEVVRNLDGDAYDDLETGMARHGVDLSGATLLPPERLQPLTDRLVTIEGIACAIAAAVDGLIFFCSPPFPTAAHCEYHLREVWPGQTYVGLGVQHVRDYIGRLP